MPITIKNPSAHGAAAQLLPEGTTETTTQHPAGEPDKATHSTEQDIQHVSVPHDWESVTVGMGFKLPVAQYTILEFVVHRTKPCPPDAVDQTYEEVKDWVENRMNQLVSDQQAAMSPPT